MDHERRRQLSASFEQGGESYDRLRPGYPAVAVDWLTEGSTPGAPVADIGAGTGKLSRSLRDKGFDVIAVDPSADMLDQLSSSGVRCRIGTGEATGLPDRSVTLATFAQSWHWVEPEAGFGELRRILRTGGRAGWVWNFLDTRVDWVRELSGIWHSGNAGEVTGPDAHTPGPGSGFGPAETTVIDWTEAMTSADLAALVTTRSYYLGAPEAEQARLRGDAEAFVVSRFGRTDRIDLPYRTYGYRAVLR